MRRAFLHTSSKVVAVVLGVGVCAGLFRVALKADNPLTSKELRRQYILSDSEAVTLLPADLAAGPRVLQAEWSPDGRSVLLVQIAKRISTQSKPPEEVRIVVWSRSTREAVTVWRAPAETASVDAVGWVPHGSVAYVTISTHDKPASSAAGIPVSSPDEEVRESTTILRVESAPARAQIVAQASPDETLFVELSPSQPAGFLERTVHPDGTPGDTLVTTIQALGPVGIIAPPFVFRRTAPGSTGPMIVGWSADGSAPIAMSRTGAADDKGRKAPVFHRIDLRARAVIPVAGRPEMFKEVTGPVEDAGALLLRHVKSDLKQGETARSVRPLWLESAAGGPQPRILVNPDVSVATFSPGRDAVLYVSQGAAWVAPLSRISAKAYMELSKQAAIEDAKQVGLALLMYSQDYDEIMPFPEHMAQKAASPYLKDDGLLGDFQYAFAGGPTAGLNGMETILGYVLGPGGKAVLYLDGSVKWQPK